MAKKTLINRHSDHLSRTPVSVGILKHSTDIIESMEPISLVEMDSVQLMNRVDTKYVMHADELGALLDRISDDYRVLTIESHRSSDYVTLYFDSPDYDAFRQHHNGRLNRHKLRMREYCSTGACFLEVKVKNNKGRTVKQRMPIPSIDDSLSVQAAEFANSLVPIPHKMQPKLWTYFTRITLVDRACLERATLDCHLRFSCGSQEATLPRLVITEVKQENDQRGSAIREQIRNLGIRPLRVSKYCLGISLLKPELKSNRFKSKLRAIRKIT